MKSFIVILILAFSAIVALLTLYLSKPEKKMVALITGILIVLMVIFKIEPNPGAGLWRPHNDQLPEERKGEGVFKIFKCLGERAQAYRDKLSQLADGDS